MVAIAAALYLSLGILVAVFFAIVISAGLGPIVTWLQKIKIPRTLGAGFLFLLIISVFAGAIYIVIPIISSEFNQLLEQFFPVIGEWLDLDTAKLSDVLSLLSEKFLSLSPSSGGGLFEFSKSVIGNAALALSVLAMSFYLTVDNRGVEKFLVAVLPSRFEQPMVDIYMRARKKIGFWLQAQIVLSLLVGAMTYFALSLLGVEHAIILGIIAAVFEVVPFVGPIFIGTIAVAVALLSSTTLALYTLIAFILIQRIESDIIVPLVMRRAVGIHPVMVLVSLLVGANLFGFVGIILSVPATVIFQEFIEDWVARKARRQQLM